VDYSDLQVLSTDFTRSYLGELVSNSPSGTYDQQVKHEPHVSYRIDNDGITIASGNWFVVDATTQGGFTDPGFVDSQTQNNYLGLTPQPSSSNLFDPPTITTTNATSTITLSGSSHGFLTSHSYSFVETKLATATSLVRPDNLQAFVDAYPDGTITILTQVDSSQNYRWDIHGEYAITTILSTSTFVTPTVTFPLSDFGVEPSLPPEEEECLCDWTALSPVPDTAWTHQANNCASFALDPLPVTTWTKRGCP
jgi:hypothetical protein